MPPPSCPCPGLIDASYVWLPLNFGANDITMSKTYSWDTEDPFAPPPPTPPPPPPTPCHVEGAGQRLRLSSCARTTPAAMKWSLSGGKLGIGGYCAGSTGSEQLALVECNASTVIDLSFSDGKAVVGKDMCFDATWCGAKICDGKFVELYKCGASTANNEGFAFDAGTGAIASAVHNGNDPLCLSVCDDS